jgi:hypothetical protein
MPTTSPQRYDVDALQAYARALDDTAQSLPIERAMGRDEARQLMSLSLSLGGAASHLRLIAVQQVLADTVAPLADLQAATLAANEVIGRIAEISRVIRLAGDVVVLGQAVALQKWVLVAPALKALRKDAAA